MELLVYLILFIVLIVGIALIKVLYTFNKKKEMEQNISHLEDFSPSQKIMGEDGNSGLAVDEGRKKICLIRRNKGNIQLDVITYRDILSSEIFEDGVTVSKTARGSQLGGALIGGLALGSVGAIIGGLSSKKISSDKVNRVDLRITVNRTDRPIHDINFMNIESKKNGIIYKAAMQRARHWHALLEVLIKSADSEDAAQEGKLAGEKSQSLSKGSVADELIKLAELRKQGLLTDEEFRTQKAKLLG